MNSASLAAPFASAFSPIGGHAAAESPVGQVLLDFGSPQLLGDLAERAEAGRAGLQLILDAYAAGAVVMPEGLAAQLQALRTRASGETTPRPRPALALA